LPGQIPVPTLIKKYTPEQLEQAKIDKREAEKYHQPDVFSPGKLPSGVGSIQIIKPISPITLNNISAPQNIPVTPGVTPPNIPGYQAVKQHGQYLIFGIQASCRRNQPNSCTDSHPKEQALKAAQDYLRVE